jgi:hypothetical protein
LYAVLKFVRILEVQFCNINSSCCGICCHLFWLGYCCFGTRKNTNS